MSTQALTRETFEQEHAALFATLRTEFMAAGASQERERIQAVRAASLPGHEQLIETLAFDGKTTGGDAALAIIAAERKTIDAAKAAHFNDAPKAAPTGRTGASAENADKPKAVVNAAKAYAGLNRAAA